MCCCVFLEKFVELNLLKHPAHAFGSLASCFVGTMPIFVISSDLIFYVIFQKKSNVKKEEMRLPEGEPGSIAWKAIILTVGLQTLLFGVFI